MAGPIESPASKSRTVPRIELVANPDILGEFRGEPAVDRSALVAALSGLAAGFSRAEVGLLGSAHFFGFFIGCWWAPRLMGSIGHIRTFTIFAAFAALSHPHLVAMDRLWPAYQGYTMELIEGQDLLAYIRGPEPTEAADWISTMAPAEAGRILWERKGCVQCHSIDGAGGIGPTFKGAYGNRRQLTDGSAVTMDENYIRESILNPRAKMVAGFDPVMPTYQGRMKEEELNALIAFMKELK